MEIFTIVFLISTVVFGYLWWSVKADRDAKGRQSQIWQAEFEHSTAKLLNCRKENEELKATIKDLQEGTSKPTDAVKGAPKKADNKPTKS